MQDHTSHLDTSEFRNPRTGLYPLIRLCQFHVIQALSRADFQPEVPEPKKRKRGNDEEESEGGEGEPSKKKKKPDVAEAKKRQREEGNDVDGEAEPPKKKQRGVGKGQRGGDVNEEQTAARPVVGRRVRVGIAARSALAAQFIPVQRYRGPDDEITWPEYMTRFETGVRRVCDEYGIPEIYSRVIEYFQKNWFCELWRRA